MKNLLSKVLLLTLLGLLLAKETVVNDQYKLTGFVSQEKSINFTKYTNPYTISVNRVKTTTPNLGHNCRGYGRSLQFSQDIPMELRLDTHLNENKSQEQSLLKSLTTLDDEQEIIEFESVSNYYFVVTTRNVVYFLKQVNGTVKRENEAKLPDEVKSRVVAKDFFVLVNDFAPLLIFPNMAILCTDGVCSQLKGWQPIKELTHATFLKTKDRRFILLGLNTAGFSMYELTANNELQLRKSFGPRNFKRSTVAIHDINVESIEKGEIYVLDYESGLYSFTYRDNDPSNLIFNKKILNQTNCFAMDVEGYKYFILNCRAGNSDYLLEVFHATAFDTYETARPMYRYDAIYDVNLADRYYSSRGFSGFKFYWVSPDTKFPHEYKSAGDLFLHNSVQARFKDNYLYYATYNEIRRVEIVEKPAYASCSSDFPTQETYVITYKTPCSESKDEVCAYQDTIEYTAWQHKEISVSRTLLPTIAAFVLLVLLALVIRWLYKRYNKQEEEISLKIANSANEFALESNR